MKASIQHFHSRGLSPFRAAPAPQQTTLLPLLRVQSQISDDNTTAEDQQSK